MSELAKQIKGRLDATGDHDAFRDTFGDSTWKTVLAEAEEEGDSLPPRRRAMSTKEKAEYVRDHGKDAYLELEW